MLLSIIIPTKNRQYTALFAIKSALSIKNDDWEVIVQDCSDTNILEEQIKNSFGNDDRINYSHTDSKPSMTENWNLALLKATGEYVCGIGDDDAVVPEIYEIAKWAKENNMDALVHSSQYMYSWPGCSNQVYNGTFQITKNFLGTTCVKHDFKERVNQLCRFTQPMAFARLPSIYHGLISKKLLSTVFNATGKMLDSTALDIYSVVTLGKYIDSYVLVDFPFSIRGSSPKSNSERYQNQKSHEHLDEFRALKMPDLLPAAVGLYATVSASFIVACKNTNQEDLIQLIDLPNLYAQIALEDPKSYDACVEKMKHYANTTQNFHRFYNIMKIERRKRKFEGVKVSLTSFIKKNLSFFYLSYRKLIPYKQIYGIYQAQNISDVLKIHQDHLNVHSIKFSPSSH
jgi:glycosyltransferase involved in cell wall biosynthesis